MRIYAIPIVKNRWAYYCHANITNPSRLNKAVQWSSKKWEELGKAKPESMKRKLYDRGSQFMNQLDYQEWFLKSVPHAQELVEPFKKVEVHHPNLLEGDQVKDHLENLMDERVPYHQKYMRLSAYWVPLSCTFVVVPIVPNIPLAYNLFRLYSHYRAFHGAEHLQQAAVVPTSNAQVNAVLDSVSFRSTHELQFPQEWKQDFNQKNKLDPKLLEQDLEGVLNKNDIRLLGETLETPGLELELNRARSQILQAIVTQRFTS
ncbi:mitochondrial K+-H+ exchange-related-domain-containing protein [Sporodiniella umbellata]|nr:mitochondrial K+-H+ exchange-related-domain-containing protein [Sporodiniella umbellata]